MHVRNLRFELDCSVILSCRVWTYGYGLPDCAMNKIVQLFFDVGYGHMDMDCPIASLNISSKHSFFLPQEKSQNVIF